LDSPNSNFDCASTLEIETGVNRQYFVNRQKKEQFQFWTNYSQIPKGVGEGKSEWRDCRPEEPQAREEHTAGRDLSGRWFSGKK
jgi:hypothetical protein